MSKVQEEQIQQLQLVVAHLTDTLKYLIQEKDEWEAAGHLYKARDKVDEFTVIPI